MWQPSVKDPSPKVDKVLTDVAGTFCASLSFLSAVKTKS